MLDSADRHLLCLEIEYEFEDLGLEFGGKLWGSFSGAADLSECPVTGQPVVMSIRLDEHDLVTLDDGLRTELRYLHLDDKGEGRAFTLFRMLSEALLLDRARQIEEAFDRRYWSDRARVPYGTSRIAV